MAAGEGASVVALGLEPSPASLWKEQSRWAVCYGLFMLSVGGGGLTAAVLHFPPNVVSITARNTVKEPFTLEFKVTGVAVLSGVVILLCFLEAFRGFIRARNLQDRATRWLTRPIEDLSTEELYRLIEHGPRKDGEPKTRRPFQLRLVWPARSEKPDRDEIDPLAGGKR